MKRNYTLDFESDSEEEVDELSLQEDEFKELDRKLENMDIAISELYDYLQLFIKDTYTHILQSNSLSEADLYKFIIDNNPEVDEITLRHAELDYEIMVNSKREN